MEKEERFRLEARNHLKNFSVKFFSLGQTLSSQIPSTIFHLAFSLSRCFFRIYHPDINGQENLGVLLLGVFFDIVFIFIYNCANKKY